MRVFIGMGLRNRRRTLLRFVVALPAVFVMFAESLRT